MPDPYDRWLLLPVTFSSSALGSNAPGSDRLFVNLFASATLDWAEQGVHVIQDASGFPASKQFTSIITISAGGSAGGSAGESNPALRGTAASATSTSEFSLSVRVPAWAVAANSHISVNGVAVAASAIIPGSYWTSEKQVWVDGDTVKAYFDMALSFEQLNDPRPQWMGVGSILYGPLLLAALSDSDSLPGDVSSAAAMKEWIKQDKLAADHGQLIFHATDSDCGGPNETSSAATGAIDATVGSIPLVPFNTIMGEEYAVYFHTAGGNNPAVGSKNSSLVIDASRVHTTGGASTGFAGGAKFIRSGNPGAHSEATIVPRIFDTSHTLVSLDFSYRYTSGYGTDPKRAGANFSLVLDSHCVSGSSTRLYSSGVLTDYPFDKGHTPADYSPAVNTTSPAGMSIEVAKPHALKLVFDDNACNVQLLLPLTVTLGWSAHSNSDGTDDPEVDIHYTRFEIRQGEGRTPHQRLHYHPHSHLEHSHGHDEAWFHYPDAHYEADAGEKEDL
jgi:hypothetical protein